MNTWSDSVVTLATRLSDHFGPIVNLIDSTADRLIGKHIAKACTGMFCTAKCFGGACGTRSVYMRSYYALNSYACTYQQYSCTGPKSCGCI